MKLLFARRSVSKELKIFFASLVFACLILGYVLSETLQDLTVLWQFNNQSYSHGYLVLGLVLYSLYERRDLLVFKPTLTTLPFALAIGLVWTATNSINVKLGEYLLLPAIFFLFIVSYVGWKNSFRFLLPTSAIFCALPIIGFLNPLLQTLSVKVVSVMVKITDVTAFIEGYFFTLPSGTLHVDTSCSGLSYLSAGITFAMIYSFLNIRRKRIIAFSLLLIIALSLIANWIRIFALVVIAYESKMQSSLVEEHAFMGWIIFAFIFMFYIYAMRLIEVRYDSKEADSDPTITDKPTDADNTGTFPYAYPLILAIAIALAPTYAGIVKQSNTELSNVIVEFPEFFSKATTETYNNQDSVFFLGSDKSYKVTGVHEGLGYTAYALLYQTQSQGKEVIYYKNKVGENLGAQNRLTLEDTSINYAIEKGTKDSVVFWFYRFGESEALTPLGVKATQLKYMFKHVPAQVLILKIQCELECESVINSQDTLNIIRQLQDIRIIE
jgi:exosortase